MPGAEKSDSFDVEEERFDAVEDTREQRLGRYLLRYEIASGGMATVYLGRERGEGGFDRAVAIKRVHPHLAKKSHFVDMFLDEARISSRIAHPNVCTVLDFGSVDGSYYMAMEYLVGVSLGSLLAQVAKDNRLLRSIHWLALASRVVVDACEGLHAAHELLDENGEPMNTVHRDVSPQNIMVTYEGATKVLDFGVALSEGRRHQTTTGTIKGKLSYMAPEHAGGLAIDRRADIWSLGVCLWETITGRRLFKRKNEMKVLKAVTEGEIPKPSRFNSAVPAMLEVICMRALSRDPDERYQTAREMGRELSEFLRAVGQRTSFADLADFMEPLFREQRDRKERIVHTVLFDVDSQEDEVKVTAAESGVSKIAEARPAPLSTEVPVVIEEEELERPPSETMEMEDKTTIDPTFPELSESAVPISGATAVVSRQTLPTRRTWVWPVLVAITLLGLIVWWMAADDSTPGATSDPSVSKRVPELEPKTNPQGTKVVTTSSKTADGQTETTQPKAASAKTPVAKVTIPNADAAKTTIPNETPIEPSTSKKPAAKVRRVVRRSPTERGTGTVNLVTTGGWADVFEGKKKLGRTPKRITLPVGRHVLKLYPQGRRDLSQRYVVRVQKDTSTRAVVALKQ